MDIFGLTRRSKAKSDPFTWARVWTAPKRSSGLPMRATGEYVYGCKRVLHIYTKIGWLRSFSPRRGAVYPHTGRPDRQLPQIMHLRCTKRGHFGARDKEDIGRGHAALEVLESGGLVNMTCVNNEQVVYHICYTQFGLTDLATIAAKQ
jgi:hypothetical protein